MRLREFQKVIRDTYFEKDRKRGREGTFRWFVEEVGELAKALRKGKGLKEEFADVLAWLVSLATLYNVDLEKTAEERYGRGCPKCGKIPCRCEEV